MPHTYTVDGRIVHVRWNGVISQEDLDSFREEMPRAGRKLGFAPDVIHTFEDTTGFSFEPIAAYRYSLKQEQFTIPNPIRVAVVATTPDGEAIATAFKTLNRAENLEMRVFANEFAARHWLARK